MPLLPALPPSPRPIATRTASTSNSRRVTAWLFLALALAAPLFLGGCNMTPEDRQFYGRGWLNPDELDRDETPHHSMQAPVAPPPNNDAMGPVEN